MRSSTSKQESNNNPAAIPRSTPDARLYTAVFLRSRLLAAGPEACLAALAATVREAVSMSGGVNGAILARGGATIQEELWAHLRELGKPAVTPGTVVPTVPGCLAAKKILHAVAIDPFYDSSVALVRETVQRALTMAREFGAKTVVMPALATGYGHLSVEPFAEARLTGARSRGIHCAARA
jgi:O-acetyl-ADP-ribose deacetylase (regulator of RNase III)